MHEEVLGNAHLVDLADFVAATCTPNTRVQLLTGTLHANADTLEVLADLMRMSN